MFNVIEFKDHLVTALSNQLQLSNEMHSTLLELATSYNYSKMLTESHFRELEEEVVKNKLEDIVAYVYSNILMLLVFNEAVSPNDESLYSGDDRYDKMIKHFKQVLASTVFSSNEDKAKSLFIGSKETITLYLISQLYMKN